MRTNVADALRQLRRADPAAAVSSADERWEGSPAKQLASERLAFERPPTQRPEGDDVLVLGPSRGRAWARRWPAIAGATVVVAAIAIGVAVLGGNGNGTPQAGRSSAGPSQQHSLPTRGSIAPDRYGPDPHEAQAGAYARHLLGLTPVLPRAVPRHTAPVPSMRHPDSTPESTNLVDLHAWWTAPGTIQDAIEYVKTHVPGALSSDGSFSGGIGGVDLQGLTFAPKATAFAAEPELLIAFIPRGNGVAVRADAQLIWIPSRPAWTTVSAPTTVVASVERGNKATVTRTLTGPVVVTQLANLVNGLDAATPGTYSCPMARFGRDQSLRFTTPHGTVRVDIATTGCAGVSVSAAGHRGFGLAASSKLERAVRRSVGLSAH